MFHITTGENMFFRVRKNDIHIRKEEGKKSLEDMLKPNQKEKS